MQYLINDPEWELIRSFCNLVLRNGIERELKDRDRIKEEARNYRYKRAKVLMIKEAYRKNG